MALNCVLVQYVQLKAYFHRWHGTWWSKYMCYRKCSVSLCLPVLQVSKCGDHRVPRIGTFQRGALHLLKGKCHHQDHLKLKQPHPAHSDHHLIIWMDKEGDRLTRRPSSELLLGNNNSVAGRRKPKGSPFLKYVGSIWALPK